MAPWLQSRMPGWEIDLAVREGDGDPHSKETEKSSQLCGLNHVTLEGNIHSIITLLHRSQSQTLAEKTIMRECVQLFLEPFSTLSEDEPCLVRGGVVQPC